MELLCYFPRFAFVASNRVPQANRIAVVHEARVRSESPEWSSSDLIPSIMDRFIGKAAAIHDPVYIIEGNLRRLLRLVKRPDRLCRHRIVLDDGNSDAISRADIVEQEIAVRVKGLFSQGIGNRELASIHLSPGLGSCQRGQVTSGASDAGKELRSALRCFRCRERLVPWRHFRSTHETGKAIDIFQVVGRVGLIVRLSY